MHFYTRSIQDVCSYATGIEYRLLNKYMVMQIYVIFPFLSLSRVLWSHWNMASNKITGERGQANRNSKQRKPWISDHLTSFLFASSELFIIRQECWWGSYCPNLSVSEMTKNENHYMLVMLWERDLQTMACGHISGPNLSCLLFLKIKFYWDTAMSIHLFIIYGCSHALNPKHGVLLCVGPNETALVPTSMKPVTC